MQAGINDIRKNMAGVIVGKEKVTDYILTAMLASGHVLLEDVPGTGKTLIAKTLAKSVDAQFSRIHRILCLQMLREYIIIIRKQASLY